eukprot:scaffold2017_cov387-Prasinococcus_capsulatus_cf.AAC.21
MGHTKGPGGSSPSASPSVLSSIPAQRLPQQRLPGSPARWRWKCRADGGGSSGHIHVCMDRRACARSAVDLSAASGCFAAEAEGRRRPG